MQTDLNRREFLKAGAAATACGWLDSDHSMLRAASMTRDTEQFVAFDRATGQLADIVLWHDALTGRGFDWQVLSKADLGFNQPEYRLRQAVQFLKEGIERMTGRRPAVRSGQDIERSMVLLLKKHAPTKILEDRDVVAALRNDGSDSYNHREAFLLRSEPSRLLIVANTIDGLVAAIPALLETVGYEVLGMGPNWTHVPREHHPRLVFDVEFSDRPSYYLRQLAPTNLQSRGTGTLEVGSGLRLADPADEAVSVSFARWSIGTRIAGHSMASFPGHALYEHHRALKSEMLRLNTTEGFLTKATQIGFDEDRPAAAAENHDEMWINSDPVDFAGFDKVFISDGTTWKEQTRTGYSVNLDPTSVVARTVVLNAFKERAAKYFAELEADPNADDEPLIYGTEPEDGAGLKHIDQWTRPANRNWYIDYLRNEQIPYPQPYVLRGSAGIAEATERWDVTSAADNVFAFNNWLLHEFDKWIDSLPAADRVTRRGTSKKTLVRCSLYSYAQHDVPPRINLDPRIHVMIAGFPKHRGIGEWVAFAKPQQVAAAFKIMLPNEPSGEYRFLSQAFYADYPLDGIAAARSGAPAPIREDLLTTYDAGIRALTCEVDFNFGKYGLFYYLFSKGMWNTHLSQIELAAIRDRWLQRAFGSAWLEMKAYYDFMLPENLPVNAPAAWAQAIRMIDAAGAKLERTDERDAQRRLDDLKQYWYFYYLIDTGAMQNKSAEFLEFLWKGQMSYMTAMQMVLRRAYGQRETKVTSHVPAPLLEGPAHYSYAETAAWWKQVLDHWPVVEVTMFADTVLANGQRGHDVDLNDLVAVKEFQTHTMGMPFRYNSAQAPSVVFVVAAREGKPLGFRFGWLAKEDLALYGPKDVPYGVEYWDGKDRQWMPVVDITTTSVGSKPVKESAQQRTWNVVDVELVAARAGTYRFELGRGGFGASLASRGYDFATGLYTSHQPLSFPARPLGLTQDPAYFYIPRGTRSLDLENWRDLGHKEVCLYDGNSAKGLHLSRRVDIARLGTHRIVLRPEETGQAASIAGNGFVFPLLYSVPAYWAKCPAELLIPRGVAIADKLSIID